MFYVLGCFCRLSRCLSVCLAGCSYVTSEDPQRLQWTQLQGCGADGPAAGAPLLTLRCVRQSRALLKGGAGACNSSTLR